MSLTYELPEGMTNGDLADEHPELHADLFSICLSTIDTGIPVINGEWYERIHEQIEHPTSNPPIHWGEDTDKTKEYYGRVLSVLYGMTTNVTRKTNEEWQETLNR